MIILEQNLQITASFDACDKRHHDPYLAIKIPSELFLLKEILSARVNIQLASSKLHHITKAIYTVQLSEQVIQTKDVHYYENNYIVLYLPSRMAYYTRCDTKFNVLVKYIL